MSAPVDVLAVLECDAARAHQWRKNNLTPDETELATGISIKARAAVAELIAAATAGQTMSEVQTGGRPMYFSAPKAARLRAALARCGGAP